MIYCSLSGLENLVTRILDFYTFIADFLNATQLRQRPDLKLQTSAGVEHNDHARL